MLLSAQKKYNTPFPVSRRSEALSSQTFQASRDWLILQVKPNKGLSSGGPPKSLANEANEVNTTSFAGSLQRYLLAAWVIHQVDVYTTVPCPPVHSPWSIPPIVLLNPPGPLPGDTQSVPDRPLLLMPFCVLWRV